MGIKQALFLPVAFPLFPAKAKNDTDIKAKIFRIFRVAENVVKFQAYIHHGAAFAQRKQIPDPWTQTKVRTVKTGNTNNRVVASIMLQLCHKPPIMNSKIAFYVNI